MLWIHTQSMILYWQRRVWQSMYVMCLYQCISTCVLCVVYVCNFCVVCVCSMYVCAHMCVSFRVYVQCMRVSVFMSTFIVQINNDVFYMRNGQWKVILWDTVYFCVLVLFEFTLYNNTALWMNLHWLESCRVLLWGDKSENVTLYCW